MTATTRIPIKAEKDYLESLAKTRSPFAALSELVWNSFDADADDVRIILERNKLDTLEEIRVQDDGSGIPYKEAETAFGHLGGSWKMSAKTTPDKKRGLHGKTGKGRFKAFALGSSVRWITRYKEGKSIKEYSIRGNVDALDSFVVEPEKDSVQTTTGTEIIITSLREDFNSLLSDSAAKKMAEEFALFLLQYSSVNLFYNGEKVDPNDAIARKDELDEIEIEVEKNKKVTLSISAIEWFSSQGRMLFLCNENGIPLFSTDLRTHTPGFHDYTAYFKSAYLEELNKDGNLIFAESDLHKGLEKVLEAGKAQLREHFCNRAAENASHLVKEWQDKNIYPYAGNAKDQVEVAERQVFDIVAVSVNEYLKDFGASSDTTKKFTFTLLKQALQENPDSLQLIFNTVLNLPKERQDDFADLLKKTTLSSIIAASRLVTDRLDFLSGLEQILFETENKNLLKERTQLHRILARETWIFGEEYHLSVDDESLTAVLQKHLKLLGRDLEEKNPVTLTDGSKGIVDLMFSRRIPQPKAEEREHLVIELKRPKVKVDLDVLTQVKKYAAAVSEDERFRDSGTRWIFWAISNDLSEEARKEGRQSNRPEGLVWDDPNLKIWAKKWGDIIDSCRARLTFFHQQLNYVATNEAGLNYLRKAHEKYLPANLKKSKDSGLK